MASEARQMDAPKRPGHFPRQGAQAVGASASFLPICTMLAPRIPGSSTPVACWLSPRGARGRFGSSGSAKFQLLEHMFVGMQSPLWVGRTLPPSPAHTAQRRLSLTSSLAREGSCTPAQGRYRAKSSTLAIRCRKAPQTHGLGKRDTCCLLKYIGLLEGQAKPPGRGA